MDSELTELVARDIDDAHRGILSGRGESLLRYSSDRARGHDCQSCI